MAAFLHGPDNPEAMMSFGDHLEDLRRRLLWALAAPLPIAIVAFFFSDTILEWLLLPVTQALHARGLPAQLQYLSPAEAIVTQLKISVVVAIVLSAPWILYQLWLFVRPGLFNQEQRFVYFLLPGSAIMSIAGTALMYFAMMPLMLFVLIGFGQQLGSRELDPRVQIMLTDGAPLHIYHGVIPPEAEPNTLWMRWPSMDLAGVVLDETAKTETVDVQRSFVSQQFQVKPTISFILLMFLAIVLAFQMPLVLVLLGWVGLATPQWLRKRRRYAILICAVISAVITPADAVSMLMMLVPLYGLYELGILLMVIAPASRVAEGSIFGRSERAAAADKRSGPADQQFEPVQSEYSVPRQPRTSTQTDQSRESDADDRDAGS